MYWPISISLTPTNYPNTGHFHVLGHFDFWHITKTYSNLILIITDYTVPFVVAQSGNIIMLAKIWILIKVMMISEHMQLLQQMLWLIVRRTFFQFGCQSLLNHMKNLAHSLSVQISRHLWRAILPRQYTNLPKETSEKEQKDLLVKERVL